MVVLGLLLLLASGALALGVVLSNTDAVSASAFGVSLSNVTVGGFFLVGAITGLVFMLGLAMLVAGTGRKRSRRAAVKAQRKDLERENADLRARLDGEPYPDEESTRGAHERTELFHRS